MINTKIKKRNKFTSKLIIYILLSIFLPVFFVNLFLLYDYNSLLNTQINNTLRQTFTQYIMHINLKLDDFSDWMDQLNYNDVIQETMKNSDSYGFEDTIMLSSKIRDEFLFQGEASGLSRTMFYSFDPAFPVDGRHLRNMTYAESMPWYDRLGGKFKSNHVILWGYKPDKPSMLSLIKPIIQRENYNNQILLGLNVTSFNAASFFFNITELDDQKFRIFVKDEDGSIIHSNKENNIDINQYSDLLTSDSTELNFHDDNGVWFIKNIPEYGLQIYYLFSDSALQREYNKMILYIILFFGLILFTFLLFSSVLSRFVSKRINMLISKMKKVEKGSLQVEETIEGNDEIAIIDSYFNRMVHRLRKLLEKNYIQRLELKEAELEALQSQIHPHFLYNTLETISSIASLHDNEENDKIRQISLKIADMLRYNINSSPHKIRSMKDEIKHIQNYLYIQKMRYGDRFEAFFDIPPELENSPILQFTLQPLVENSIYHGFEEKRGKGHLEISAEESEDCVIVTVQDDGVGMSDEKLQELLDYINNRSEPDNLQTRKSIGVKNVHSRIKLTFGDDFGLFFHSEQSRGTRISIKLPITFEGDQHV